MTSAMRLARTTGGSSCAGGSSGMLQSSGSDPGLGGDRRPQLDNALQVTANRLVTWRRLPRGCDAAPRQFGSEGHVNRVENGLRRPERDGQRDVGEWPPAVAMTLREFAPHFGEHLRRRALEGEDRLLLVADREDGAVLGPCAGAGEELGAERRKNAPLRLRRVLGFVEQQVIEPIVELVQNPRGA